MLLFLETDTGFILPIFYTVYEANSQHQTGHFCLAVPDFLNITLQNTANYVIWLVQSNQDISPLTEGGKGKKKKTTENQKSTQYHIT